MNSKLTVVLLFFFSFIFPSLGLCKTRHITLNLTEQNWELDKGIVTHIYSYNKTMPGQIIRGNVGDVLDIQGKNELPIHTNIHWHGLEVPADQDGPDRDIAPNKSFSYRFRLENTGTYWFHAHMRSVTKQIDMGLFAPFIVDAPEDKKYDQDKVVVIDDLFIDKLGKRIEGVGVGHMERLGNTLAINGKIRGSIVPLTFQQGGVNKIRFLATSTAAYFRIHFAQPVRVTHEDGAGLSHPKMTKDILLSPAERIDVEYIGKEPGNFPISIELTDRREKGKDYGVSTTLPLIVKKNDQPIKSYVYVPVKKESVSFLLDRKPDYTLTLASRMKRFVSAEKEGSHMHGMHMAMEWTINGEVYPNVPPLNLKVGRWVKIRFYNKDHHTMDHPMHIHGTHFRVLDINGSDQGLYEPGLERDVFDVPSKGYVDIAFRPIRPGRWMLHCHILDHEDGGMMMVINATP